MYNQIDIGNSHEFYSIKKRIQELKNLIKVKDKFENNIINEYNIQHGIETTLQEFHREENKKILLAIENKKEDEIEKQDKIIKAIEDSKIVKYVKDQKSLVNITELDQYDFDPNFEIPQFFK